MKVVIQRSKKASVAVEDQVVGDIEQGLVLLVGISSEDTYEDLDYVARKVAHMRIFEDDTGKMNHSVLESGGEILSISQFTLYGDTRKGRRPSFIKAAKPEQAEMLYTAFNDKLRSYGLRVATGRFGAMMDIALTNDGPVTLIVDSKDQKGA